MTSPSPQARAAAAEIDNEITRQSEISAGAAAQWSHDLDVTAGIVQRAIDAARPDLLGHPATASACAAFEEHHLATDQIVHDFCAATGQVGPPWDVDRALAWVKRAQPIIDSLP